MAQRLAALDPVWLEEPLRADRPWDEWQRLRAATPIAARRRRERDRRRRVRRADRLAGDRRGAARPRPSGAASRASSASSTASRAAGLRYCPHYLGAGIGLLASAHLLAARGSADRVLEVDSNENPLRSALCPPLATLQDGSITLSDAPGLGVEPDLANLRELCR